MPISSRNWQSNFSIKKNIKLQSPKCQLNFKRSTKFLTNQSQIQTKTQPETVSHPKHIVQARDNDNISKSIKRKDAKQGKLQKNQLQIQRKRNSRLNAPLQWNSKPTLCLQQRYIYIQRKYTEMNAISRIRLVSQQERQYKKGRSHRSIKFQNTIVVYVMVTIYYFLMFFISCCFWIFLQIFPTTQTKSFKVCFIFLISVFAVFNIDNLNVCHRNFDVNRNHYNCTTFTTKILDINRIRYNCGEMAEITCSHLDQHYRKYIFRNSIVSHNLQRAEGNGDNIKFYWINFITSLLFYAHNFTTQN